MKSSSIQLESAFEVHSVLALNENIILAGRIKISEKKFRGHIEIWSIKHNSRLFTFETKTELVWHLAAISKDEIISFQKIKTYVAYQYHTSDLKKSSQLLGPLRFNKDIRACFISPNRKDAPFDHKQKYTYFWNFDVNTRTLVPVTSQYRTQYRPSIRIKSGSQFFLNSPDEKFKLMGCSKSDVERQLHCAEYISRQAEGGWCVQSSLGISNESFCCAAWFSDSIHFAISYKYYRKPIRESFLMIINTTNLNSIKVKINESVFSMVAVPHEFKLICSQANGSVVSYDFSAHYEMMLIKKFQTHSFSPVKMSLLSSKVTSHLAVIRDENNDEQFTLASLNQGGSVLYLRSLHTYLGEFVKTLSRWIGVVDVRAIAKNYAMLFKEPKKIDAVQPQTNCVLTLDF